VPDGRLLRQRRLHGDLDVRQPHDLLGRLPGSPHLEHRLRGVRELVPRGNVLERLVPQHADDDVLDLPGGRRVGNVRVAVRHVLGRLQLRGLLLVHVGVQRRGHDLRVHV
jgi:hypothetical protein